MCPLAYVPAPVSAEAPAAAAQVKGKQRARRLEWAGLSKRSFSFDVFAEPLQGTGAHCAPVCSTEEQTRWHGRPVAAWCKVVPGRFS